MASNLLRQEGYICVREIGKGAFGAAFHVKKNKEDLVCKAIDLTTATEKEKRSALKEAELLTKFKNPFVVKYVDHFMSKGWLMIVQEFCEGGDLQVQIQQRSKNRRPFDACDVTKWFTHAILGLKYLHDKHILHRDLKSSNFFLKEGELKIGDFGIAKVLSNTRCFAKTAIGTPYYLSPEVVRGEMYSWPSDMWAMGCFLYELLQLKPPFEGRAMKDLMNKISKGSLPRWPAANPLSPIGEELLQRDHRRRPKPRDLMLRPVIQEEIRRIKSVADNKLHIDEEADCQSPEPRDLGSPPPVYKIGSMVEYWSETHQDWLATRVTAVNAHGAIQLSVKPNSWILPNLQGSKVRPAQIPPTPARARRNESPAIRASREPSPLVKNRDPSPLVGKYVDASPMVGKYRDASPMVGKYREPSPLIRQSREPSPLVRQSREPSPLIRPGREPSPLIRQSRDPSPLVRPPSSSRRNSPTPNPGVAVGRKSPNMPKEGLPPTRPPNMPNGRARAECIPPSRLSHDLPGGPAVDSPQWRSPADRERQRLHGDIALRSQSPHKPIRNESPAAQRPSPGAFRPTPVGRF